MGAEASGCRMRKTKKFPWFVQNNLPELTPEKLITWTKALQKQDGIHRVPEGQRSPIKLPDLLLPDQSMQTTQPPFSEHCFVNTGNIN